MHIYRVLLVSDVTDGLPPRLRKLGALDDLELTYECWLLDRTGLFILVGELSLQLLIAWFEVADQPQVSTQFQQTPSEVEFVAPQSMPWGIGVQVMIGCQPSPKASQPSVRWLRALLREPSASDPNMWLKELTDHTMLLSMNILTAPPHSTPFAKPSAVGTTSSAIPPGMMAPAMTINGEQWSSRLATGSVARSRTSESRTVARLA